MSFEEQNAQFVQWLKDNGVTLSGKIALHDYRSEGQGRGVIATDDIEKDEMLFSVPRDSVLAVDNDEKFSGLMTGDNDFGVWLNLMAYMIVAEKDPRWKPYYDMLPDKFNTPMFWTDEQLQMLTGSALKDKVGKEEAEEQYNEQIKPFLDGQNVGNSLDAFHRMGSIIMSYSFDVQKKSTENNKGNDQEDEEEEYDDHVKAMVPMADMLNAHTRLCNAHLCHGDGVLEMRAVKKIPKGGQVYNTYGELPNSDLLRRYGYVESGGTEFDVVEIPTELIGKALKESGFSNVDSVIQKLEEDEENEFYDDGYDIPASGEPDLANLAILEYLVITTSGQSDLPSSRKLFKAIAKTCEDEKWTQQAKDIWVKVLQMRLQEYPQELVQEAQNNPDPEPTDAVVVDPQEMCKEVLLGEIRILHRSLKWANEATELVTIESILNRINKRSASQANETNKKQKT